tara:strand:+ start:153 stop:956 length:804 start_codon:yes stop_codon:yes gene_type:complete
MAQLEGQTALITGGGRGIGRAIALRLAHEGADVALADLNEDWAQETAQKVTELGRKSLVVRTDVGDYDQVQSLAAQTVGTLGKIDILVNNAGISKARPFLELSKEDWEAQLRTHMSGTFYCSQAAARDMSKRGYGRIICISSVAALMGPIDLAAYGAAKAGVAGLVRAMALELADHGITANAVAPGPIDTELLRSAWPKDVYEERANHIPVQRLGVVEEIAHAVAFFASPQSGYISGTILPVDGGSVAAGAYMVEQYRRRKALGIKP